MLEPLAVTITEAAKSLSVSPSTVRAMIADKRLPFVRVVGRKGSRGRIVIRVDDLAAVLNKGVPEAKARVLARHGVVQP
jgi:excisionase family DNA binding protein